LLVALLAVIPKFILLIVVVISKSFLLKVAEIPIFYIKKR